MSMKITVKLKENEYDIHIGHGLLDRAGEFFDLNRRVFLVTDTDVPEQYAEKLAAQCQASHIERINAGEGSKNLAVFERLLNAMLEFNMTRQDCVIAVGGGVVGDVSGFAASCYMRGIDFYNVPTTLLAQVDSSVGGKTAVDLGGVKNVVGSFYQPKGVLIDPEVLKTLPERLIREGLAEAIKMALTCDRDFFDFLKRNPYTEENAEKIIYHSLCVKTGIVSADEREAGLRRVLNFGHTVGHAIESAAGGKLLHGECVALGMLPMCGDSLRCELKKALKMHGLSTELPFPAEELMPYIEHDKKAQSDGIIAILADEPGSYRLEKLTLRDINDRIEAVR